MNRQLSGTRQGLLNDWNEGAKLPLENRAYVSASGRSGRWWHLLP